MALPFWNRKNSFSTQYICKLLLKQNMRVSDTYYRVAEGSAGLIKPPVVQEGAAKP